MPNTYEDPQIAQQKALAQALMAKGLNPQSIDGHYRRTNQAADLVSALVGTMGAYKANQRQQADDTAFQQTIANALKGPQAPADGVGPVQDQNDYLVQTLAGNKRTAPMALEYEMQRRQREADAQARAQLKGDADPYFSPVQTSGGLFKFDARTGKYEPMVGADGKPLLPPAIDATAQGDVARKKAAGTEAGKAEGDIEKRTIGANEILDLVTRAEELIPKATSSGIGTLVDAVGAVAGKSPQGADEAAALKVIAGNLTLKQPRMEGPQSDADRKLYAAMAANVGDSTLPASQRLFALKEIRRLNEKYAAFNGAFDGGVPTRPADGGTPAAGPPTLRYNPATGGFDQ